MTVMKWGRLLVTLYLGRLGLSLYLLGLYMETIVDTS